MARLVKAIVCGATALALVWASAATARQQAQAAGAPLADAGMDNLVDTVAGIALLGGLCALLLAVLWTLAACKHAPWKHPLLAMATVLLSATMIAVGLAALSAFVEIVGH